MWAFNVNLELFFFFLWTFMYKVQICLHTIEINNIWQYNYFEILLLIIINFVKSLSVNQI